MAVTPYDNTEDIIDNWEYPIDLKPSDNLYKLLQVIASENERIDLDLESLYDDRFVQSATGKELEKLGDFVGINRKTGESDKKLRKRILGGFASQASDTTYEEFTSAALLILDTSPSTVTFTTPPDTTDPKTVEIEVDGAVLDNHPLTVNEITVLLNGALSVDAGANIIEGGTFAFAGDDTTLEGFDQGTWSSTLN